MSYVFVTFLVADGGAVVTIQLNEAKHFAFVEFRSADITTEALRVLQHKELQGRVIKWGRPHSYVPPNPASAQTAPSAAAVASSEPAAAASPAKRQAVAVSRLPVAITAAAFVVAEGQPISLQEVQPGDWLAWKAMKLDEETWQPVVGPERFEGRVEAVEPNRDCVWLAGEPEPRSWKSLIDVRKIVA